MFDDNQENNNPPSNLPVDEPEDIFAGVSESGKNVPSRASAIKDALSAGVLQPKQENDLGDVANSNINDPSDLDIAKQTESLNQVTQYKMKEPVFGKILFIILLVVIVILLLFVGWYVYGKFFGPKSNNNNINNTTNPTVSSSNLNITTTSTNTTTNNTTSTITSSSTDVANEQTTDQILFGQPIDTDGDSLDDIREKKLGTDINKKDTDNDGLTDGDEILIWNTNPLNSDTDGDTYLDGHEVKNGYSPVGSGKLYNVPTSTTSSSN